MIDQRCRPPPSTATHVRRSFVWSRPAATPNFGVVGARFALLDGDDGEIRRATTSAGGTVDFRVDRSVHPPPYRIRELAAPAGLVPLEDDIEVAAPDGVVSTDPDGPTVVNMENRTRLHELMILKRVVGATPVPDDLAGFTFAITRPARDDRSRRGHRCGRPHAGRIRCLPGTTMMTETARPEWWPGDQPLPRSASQVTIPRRRPTSSWPSNSRTSIPRRDHVAPPVPAPVPTTTDRHPRPSRPRHAPQRRHPPPTFRQHHHPSRRPCRRRPRRPFPRPAS